MSQTAQLTESGLRKFEAAHWVVARVLGLEVGKVSIHGNGEPGVGGFARVRLPPYEVFPISRRKARFADLRWGRRQAVAIAAGMAVSFVFHDEIKISDASTLIRDQKDLDLISRDLFGGVDQRWITARLCKATRMLPVYWPEILAVAEALLERGTLTRGQAIAAAKRAAAAGKKDAQ